MRRLPSTSSAERRSGFSLPREEEAESLSQCTACRSQRVPHRGVAVRRALSQRTACRSQRHMCTKHRVRICGMRCESVDSFSGITKDACADYFPVLFYCQGNQRCHYRQSRTDNRPVFYGANCTGFFCKLLLRTYARMLLRIPILESVFGISDNLRID